MCFLFVFRDLRALLIMFSGLPFHNQCFLAQTLLPAHDWSRAHGGSGSCYLLEYANPNVVQGFRGHRDVRAHYALYLCVKKLFEKARYECLVGF